jgi:hypothetical protein
LLAGQSNEEDQDEKEDASDCESEDGEDLPPLEKNLNHMILEESEDEKSEEENE